MENNVVKTRGFKVKLDLEKDKDTIKYIDKFVADTAKFGMTHQNVLKLMVNEFMKKFPNGAADVLMNNDTPVRHNERIGQPNLKNQSTTYVDYDEAQRLSGLIVGCKLAIEVRTRLSVCLELLNVLETGFDVLTFGRCVTELQDAVDKIIALPSDDDTANELLSVATAFKSKYGNKKVSLEELFNVFYDEYIKFGSVVANIEKEIGEVLSENGEDLNIHNNIVELEKCFANKYSH